jgi:predicted PurR-regulated permease PerM
MTDDDTKPSTAVASAADSENRVRVAIEITVRLGVVLLLVGWCLQIVAPFIGILVWALVIAIGSTTPYEKLVSLLGERRGLAATVVVLAGLLVLIVPAVMLSETLVSGAQYFADDVAEGRVTVPPPPAKVADWPIVGERLFEAWQLASVNLEEALVRLKPQLQTVSIWLLSAAQSAGVAMLQLVASIVLAGFMLVRSEERLAVIERVGERLAGPKGAELAGLANATVRSVVQGIVGVAIVQGVLAGIGFIVAGIPAAGLWAMLVLVAAVVQLPVALVMVAPILLGFSILSTQMAVVFAIWCVAVSLVDNFLKPILFGRGAQVPTIVIFVGAIGGMLTMGIIGLFVGAVVLALGYEILRAWLDDVPQAAEIA